MSLPMPPSPTPRNQSPTGKVTLGRHTQLISIVKEGQMKPHKNSMEFQYSRDNSPIGLHRSKEVHQIAKFRSNLFKRPADSTSRSHVRTFARSGPNMCLCHPMSSYVILCRRLRNGFWRCQHHATRVHLWLGLGAIR